MRITAVIALFLLALCAPAHALAGTFVVPFGGGTSMLAAGWAPRADAPAVCVGPASHADRLADGALIMRGC